MPIPLIARCYGLSMLQADDNVGGNKRVETFNEIEVRRIRRTTADRPSDNADKNS